jgi:hypothetical protein
MPPEWDLEPEQSIKRVDLHGRFGGSGQGGITRSSSSPNVLVFTDPATGNQHGYHDEWLDGVLHYYGEGQRGDQEMTRGNAAILSHASEGNALRVFEGARGTVTYLGEFELDDVEPSYRTDGIDRDEQERQVIVFRLRPLSIEPREAGLKLPEILDAPSRVDIPVERQLTERFYVDPTHETYAAERREQALVLIFETHLKALGHEVSRQKFRPPGEARPILTDLFDATTGLLVEAKGSGRRGAIRMAIGQLADYRRFFKGGEVQHLALLVPDEPRQDLCDLLSSQGIAWIFATKDGFEDSTGGALVGH